MKLLLERSNCHSSWRLEKTSRISPEKELDERSRYVSCFNLEIVEGIWPAKSLSLKSNALICVRLPMELGTEPENWHRRRFKIFKELKAPIESRSSPNIPVDEISNSNRLLLEWSFGKTPLRRGLSLNLRFFKFSRRKKLSVRTPHRLVFSRSTHLKEEEEIFTGIEYEMST